MKNNMEKENLVLMPVSTKFIDVFEIFMNDEQKAKVRANNVRQYVEGIIDLLLKDKILPFLKPTEDYSCINWGRKIKIIEEHYDKSIAGKIQQIFKIGGEGSHFNGQVRDEELQEIIKQATHIVEDMFVKYFLVPEHKFGCENIFTIFSMLPPHNRIYILENVYIHYKNQYIVDRLSLAYLKHGEKDKAIAFLNTALQEVIIDDDFHSFQLNKINVLGNSLSDLYETNAKYEHNSECSKALLVNGQIVIGLPTSNDVFDTARAVKIFRQWFEEDKDRYPEFINLFLCLMTRDERQYI
ncbi:hypothetical protein [Sporomusa sphaeroides]|uniref:DUF4145 domain-containing protein n=1 Tax=Sporomusa sphaeroides DSM 2875 TaxID=1337886 RepID=A0ABM9W4K7_9FIRM|nr:hypothetical protein [Sporomusa sphaeroides]OLS54748.1 hypothetical protein SPSPH_40810 [Sporomusa sphaeroides DSM 2875]CVK20103.1 hypothetical protein SSPH_02770 [Sporomusa sphaeroides DSM 2875]